MPHIHVQPNEHDMTLSAFIVRKRGDEMECLVHMHRKVGKLMQIGGHLELDETPWQTMVSELAEESGYRLEDVELLQPVGSVSMLPEKIVHPIPFLMNTHAVGDDHFHSDIAYGFIEKHSPSGAIDQGQSKDLRWHTIDELTQLTSEGICLEDIVPMYEQLLRLMETWEWVDPASYSLEKPSAETGITYQWGKPAELR